MEIHLIRHTAVENPDNVCYGFAEIPLRNNPDDLNSISLDKDFDLVISSPSQRCQLLAKHFQLNYETDERIREMNFGNWELKKWTDIPEKEIQLWYEDFIHVKAPDGESLMDMKTRVSAFWNELVSKENLNKILIVTHAGVIRLVLLSVLQFPLENMFRIETGYGRRTVIVVKDGLTSVKSLNR